MWVKAADRFISGLIGSVTQVFTKEGGEKKKAAVVSSCKYKGHHVTTD